jgi:hypothetical protein
MATIPKTFLILSVTSFLVGFSGLGGPSWVGLGKALGGVFFILFFIFHILGPESAKQDAELEEYQSALSEGAKKHERTKKQRSARAEKVVA